MASLLGVVALVAAVILGWRAMQRRTIERSQPGRSPGSAIAIEDYGDMDVAVRMQVCRCGGRFEVRGEGPTREPHLRMAQLECRRCEREQRLYFDLSTIRH